jgi:protein-tyrosine phosphatase
VIDQSPIDARRIIALEGGRNFRDLGGYRTQDGRRVKWRKIFRSGSMAGVTPADQEQLAKLSIRTICDLRTIHERETDPCNWHRTFNISYWSRDYAEGFGELRTLMASPLATKEDARSAMIEGYRRLPFQQAPGYKELFKRLAAGDVPLAFNCSAGKDRAGTAAALVLSALDVPRETVLQDYLLTDRIVDFKSLFMERAQQRKSSLATQSEDIIAAVLGTDVAYLNAALDAVERQHESVAGYAQEVLGIDREALSDMQRLLLE